MNANPEDEAEYEVNMFTDRTQEEFEVLLGLKNHPVNEPEDVNVITHVDENRLKDCDLRGKCSPIKDQGSCGSCWAFAANGAQECTMNMKGKGRPNLSEQDLVDCSRSQGNQGCNGGWYYYAWNYIKNYGIALEIDYKYAGRDGSCRSVSRGNKIVNYDKITGTTSAVQTALNSAPLAVAVDASNWSSYKTGTFSNCGTSINHAVVAVGYDSANNWLIRNSWGTRWGNSGHMTLKAGNTCGVLGYVYRVNV